MGKRILLIDESAMLRRIAASVLGAQPGRYEVLAATRATEGFVQACNNGVGLVLVDQRLANLPGDDLTRRLHAEPRTAHLPVVLLVGRGVPLPPLASLPANVVETLGKPFAPEQLASVVNAIVDLTRNGVDFEGMRSRLHPAPRPVVVDPPFRAAVEEAVPIWGVKPISQTPNRSTAFIFRRDAGLVSIRATMQQAAHEGHTGVLRLRPSGTEPVEVFCENGRVVVVTTRDADVYSRGASDALSDKVSPATLEAAVLAQARDGVPFLLTLGTHGLLSKAAAESLMHQFGQRCFARLWTMKPSSLPYDFEVLDALPGFAMRLSARPETVDEWLFGTLRQLRPDDLTDLARHEGMVGTPHPCKEADAVLQPLLLTSDERGFCEGADGRHSLPTLAKQLGLTPEVAFLLLHRFRCLEAMDYHPAPAAFVVTPRTRLRRVLPLKR